MFRQLTLFCLMLLLLVACAPASPAAEPAAIEEKQGDSMTGDATMADKDDDMAGDMMEEKDDGMAGDMMDEKDDDMAGDMMEEKDDDMAGDMMDEKDDDMAGGMMEEKDDMMAGDMMETPAWFTMPLTDIHSGESFTVKELEGKVILIETMAIWCSNCLRQQQEIKSLHALLGERDDLVSVAINIDPNEQAGALKSYTMRHGFDWVYTVAPVELSRELSQLYGNQILNPPSVPMFIIDRKGEVHLLPSGIKSAAELQRALEPFLEM
jgi:thiol-disulfide isomerase/thioredoxin